MKGPLIRAEKKMHKHSELAERSPPSVQAPFSRAGVETAEQELLGPCLSPSLFKVGGPILSSTETDTRAQSHRARPHPVQVLCCQKTQGNAVFL